MKKITRTVLWCAVLLTCLCFNAKTVNAKTDGYKVTKYKTFSAVKKDYLKKETYKDFGLDCAYKTLKTKYGNKKAMIICQSGFTPDCSETNIFIRHKKKIYRIANFTGYANSISKNKKYIYISGGSSYFMIYKYSNGLYKKYKYVFNNGQKKYDKQKDKLSKKYGVSNINIKYTYHKGV